MTRTTAYSRLGASRVVLHCSFLSFRNKGENQEALSSVGMAQGYFQKVVES